MSSDTVTITLPRPRIGRRTLAGLACAAAGALAATGVLALTQHSSSPPQPAVYTAPAKAFRLALPAGWRAAPASEVAALPSHPLAVLRSRDGSGAVVVQQAASTGADPAALTKQLTAQLAQRFRPFKPLTARLVPTRSGPAYMYAFAHGNSVQTIAVVAAGGRDYTINGIVATGATERAREVGAIVGSFGR